MIKTEEIIIKGKNKNSSCDIFCYEPETIEETVLGSLYMVSEINADEDSQHLTNLISSLIKREYYAAPHRGPLESLETSLKKTNLFLKELSNKGNADWLSHLHFVCAAINKEEQLFLSQSGSAQAFLCREGALSNITKKIVPAPEKPHPGKIFQSVISGGIGPADKIIFATPYFFQFFSPAGFKQLFENPKLENISDQIHKVLREHKRPAPLSALLLEIMPEQELASLPTSAKKDFITPPIRLEEIIN